METINPIFVTSSVINTWDKTGRDQIIATSAQFSESRDAMESSSQSIGRLLLELVLAVAQGSLSVDRLVALLQKMNVGTNVELQTLLVDTLWLFDMDEKKEWKARLVELIKNLLSQQLVNENRLKEQFEDKSLEELGIVNSADMFGKKVIRINTKLLYEQKKYNLFREESEGYAKLMTELAEPSRLTVATADTVIEQIRSLIGYFDLDPNRVLDVILDAFERNPRNDCFIKLIRLFSPSALPHILGFKYQFYQNLNPADKEAVGPTPTSLYQVTAQLLRFKLLKLSDLWPHIGPSDEYLKTQQLNRVKKNSEKAHQVNVVSLASKAEDDEKPTDRDKRDVSETGKKDRLEEKREREREKERERQKEIEKQKEAETGEVQEEDTDDISENQKLGLLESVIRFNAWGVAQTMFMKMIELDPAQHPLIHKALCELTHWLIEPVYRTISPSRVYQSIPSNILRPLYPFPVNTDGSTVNQLTQPSTLSELIPVLLSVLRWLGVFLSRDPLLFAKTARLLSAVNSQKVAVQEELEVLLARVVLPALSLLGSNPAANVEVWNVMKDLRYDIRYRIYGEWKTYAYPTTPELVMAKALAIRDCRKWLKRISKENSKSAGRQLAKFTNSQPLIVLDLILDQCQSYDNQIQPVVNSLSYLSSFALDVCVYLLLEHIATPDRERLDPVDATVSWWLVNLASFTGYFFRKYSHVDISGVLTYLANRLGKGQSLDLIIMREIIAKMAGWEPLVDLNQAQLDSQAGGVTLRLETASLTSEFRATKKSSARLRDALVQSNLSHSLWINMCRQRETLIFNSDIHHLKLLGTQFDNVHDVLVQYTEFLSLYTDSESGLRATFPSLSQLVDQKLSPDVAFFLARPGLPKYWQQTDEQKQEMEQLARQMLPVQVWDHLSLPLYCTFWSLSLYDIHVPRERYESEISRLKAEVAQLEDSSKHLDNSTAAVGKRKKDRERCLTTIDKLKAELKEQETNHNLVMEKLKQSKDSLMIPSNTSIETAAKFLQYCIYPRVLFTPADAIYSAKFVELIHSLNTPYFSTLNYLDKAGRAMTPLIHCCTEREAGLLGIFLEQTLSKIRDWVASEDVFKRECMNSPGFCVSFDDPSAKRAQYSEFVAASWKWHARMTRVFVQTLSSTEYMEVRNALVLLNKIVDLYPAKLMHATHVEAKVAKLKESERDDLKLMASRYHAQVCKTMQTLPAEPGKEPIEREVQKDGSRESQRDKEKEEKRKGDRERRREEDRDSREREKEQRDRDRDRDRERERERDRSEQQRDRSEQQRDRERDRGDRERDKEKERESAGKEDKRADRENPRESQRDRDRDRNKKDEPVSAPTSASSNPSTSSSRSRKDKEEMMSFKAEDKDVSPSVIASAAGSAPSAPVAVSGKRSREDRERDRDRDREREKDRERERERDGSSAKQSPVATTTKKEDEKQSNFSSTSSSMSASLPPPLLVTTAGNASSATPTPSATIAIGGTGSRKRDGIVSLSGLPTGRVSAMNLPPARAKKSNQDESSEKRKEPDETEPANLPEDRGTKRRRRNEQPVQQTTPPVPPVERKRERNEKEAEVREPKRRREEEDIPDAQAHTPQHQQQQQQQSTQRRSDKSGSAPRDKPVPISLSSTDGNVSATVPVPSSTAAGAAGVVVGGLTSQEKQERDLRERLQKSQRQAVTATSANTQQEGAKQDKETVEPVRTNRRVREYPPPPPQNSQQQYPPRGPANPSNQGPVQYSYQERDDFQRDQPPPPPNGRGNPRGDRDKKQYRRNQ